MKNVILIVGLLLSGLCYPQTTESTIYAKSFEQAQERAQKENKDILLIFSGSDWSRPYIIFEKSILKNVNFKIFAQKHLVIYKADFPRKPHNALPKSQEDYNRGLASKFNTTNTFPKLILFSNQLKSKTTLSHTRMTAKDFIAQIKKVSK